MARGTAGGLGGLSMAEVGDLLAAIELPQYAAAARASSADPGGRVEDLGALWDRLGVGFAAHRLKIAKRLAWAARAAPDGAAASAAAAAAAAGRLIPAP